MVASNYSEGELRLTVNEQKSRIVHSFEGVKYLGVTIHTSYTRIKREKVREFKDKVKTFDRGRCHLVEKLSLLEGRDELEGLRIADFSTRPPGQPGMAAAGPRQAVRRSSPRQRVPLHLEGKSDRPLPVGGPRPGAENPGVQRRAQLSQNALIFDLFRGRVQLSFGIGIEPLNIVSKMVLANGRPVAKISDAPGKSMCDDPDYLRYLASVYDIVPAAGNPGDDD